MEDDASVLLDGKTLANLRVVDLKLELEKRGLSKSGSKKDLVKRLKQQLEFEKLSQRKSTGDSDDLKIELDADTEQNEFVQQYLAQQQKIYAQQKEVKRQVELEEIQKSGDEKESCDSGKGDEDKTEDESEPEPKVQKVAKIKICLTPEKTTKDKVFDDMVHPASSSSLENLPTNHVSQDKPTSDTLSPEIAVKEVKKDKEAELSTAISSLLTVENTQLKDEAEDLSVADEPDVKGIENDKEKELSTAISSLLSVENSDSQDLEPEDLSNPDSGVIMTSHADDREKDLATAVLSSLLGVESKNNEYMEQPCDDRPSEVVTNEPSQMDTDIVTEEKSSSIIEEVTDVTSKSSSIVEESSKSEAPVEKSSSVVEDTSETKPEVDIHMKSLPSIETSSQMDIYVAPVSKSPPVVEESSHVETDTKVKLNVTVEPKTSSSVKESSRAEPEIEIKESPVVKNTSLVDPQVALDAESSVKVAESSGVVPPDYPVIVNKECVKDQDKSLDVDSPSVVPEPPVESSEKPKGIPGEVSSEMSVSSVPYSLSDIQLPDSPATNLKTQTKSGSVCNQSDEEQASNNTNSNISKKLSEGDMNGKASKPEIKEKTSEKADSESHKSKAPGVDNSNKSKTQSDSSSEDEKVKSKEKDRRKRHHSSEEDRKSPVKKSSASSRSRRKRNHSSSPDVRRSRSKSPRGSKSSRRSKRRSPSSEKEHRSKGKHKKDDSKKEKSKKRSNRSPSSDRSPTPEKDRSPRKPYKVRRKERTVSTDDEKHSKTRKDSPKKDAKVDSKDRSVSSSDERSSRTRSGESPKREAKSKERSASSSDERNSRMRSWESPKREVKSKDKHVSSGDERKSRPSSKEGPEKETKSKDRSASSGDERKSRPSSRESPKKDTKSFHKDRSGVHKSRTRSNESPKKETKVSQREKSISPDKDHPLKLKNKEDAMEIEQSSKDKHAHKEVLKGGKSRTNRLDEQSLKKPALSDSETSSSESSPLKESHSAKKDTIQEQKRRHSVSSDDESVRTDSPVKKSMPSIPEKPKESPKIMDCDSSKEEPPASRRSRRDSSSNSKNEAKQTNSSRSRSPEKVAEAKLNKRPPSHKESSPDPKDAVKVSKNEASDGELPSSGESSPARKAGERKPSTDSSVSRSGSMIVIRKEAPKQKLKIKRDNVIVVKKDKEEVAEEKKSITMETAVVETPEPIESPKLEPGECPDVPPNTNYVRRKIVLSSRKQVEKTSDEPATKKSKWGSFAASRRAKQTVSISSDSLKTWFPDFKILKEPAADAAPEDLPSPGNEEHDVEMAPIDKVSEPSEPKMIAITRRLEPLPAEAVLKPPQEPVQDDEQGVEPTPILLVQNLVRPFTLFQLKELLGENGKMVEDGFWIDKIKSKCFVTYETVEEAVNTRKILNGARWPMSNPKILAVSFATEEDLSLHRSGLADQPKPRPPSPPKEEPQSIRREREGRTRMVVPMREWDKDKVTQESPEKLDRRRDEDRLRDKKDSKKKLIDDTPAKLLDDLFQKTKATPCIYWLPLTQEQIKERDERRKQIKLERDRRNQEREQENKRPRSRQRDTRRSSSRSRSPVTRRH